MKSINESCLRVTPEGLVRLILMVGEMECTRPYRLFLKRSFSNIS